MWVLMLNYEFPPLGGGGSNACRYILEELSKEKVDVDLVTSSATGVYETEKIGETVNVYKLPINKKNIHYWTQREIISYSWKARKLAKNLMKEREYDLCHAFFGFPCGAIAYLFRRKVPYIVSLRGSDVPGFNKRFSLQYLFLKPIIRNVWKNSKAVISNSEGLKELALKTQSSAKIDIIPNGIDTEEFKPTTKGNDTKLRILSVSRLIKRKGIEYLLEGIQMVKEIFGDGFEVCIVGEGNQEQELKVMARQLKIDDVVIFEGYIEHAKLSAIYSNSDIFVLPSLNEGMSNTILEAMASGLPIITTDTGGTKELIDGNGIIVPMENSKAIADAIGRLTEDSRLRDKMGEKSREIAEGMDWKNVAEEYNRLYRKIKCTSEH